jgi:hypothetical protein
MKVNTMNTSKYSPQAWGKKYDVSLDKERLIQLAASISFSWSCSIKHLVTR